MLNRLNNLLGGLEVDARRMRENLESSFGVVFSQPVLLALVEIGLSRDEAYRIVQDDAAKAFAEHAQFRDVLVGDKRVTLTSAQLDIAFDVQRAVRHAARTIDSLIALRP